MISSVKNSPHSVFSDFLVQDLNTELLRFTTAGSVDDGKSTLIGRLLHDSKAVYEDQLASVKKSRINRSTGPVDFSLLTDGLRAEREQGITIDVAYRYFATARRKFIIADTPGHEQYTRNMATGASTADLAVILIDGTKGLLPQTRRHAFIASLLGISNVLAAVNKMDLAEYREDDNVVDRSNRMPWYDGPTLLEHLETVPLPEKDSLQAFRFPVQTVIRPDATFRGFAGRIASGAIHPGDSVVALPSGRKTRVRSIVTYDGELPQASSSMSVTLQLDEEIDLSRGDMLVSPGHLPKVSRKFHAKVVWLHGKSLELGRTYLVKHTARQTKIRALHIRHRVDISTLAEDPATRLEMNEIGSVEFETHVPLFFDPYSSNRTTGSFILIDAATNATVGAGMIQEDVTATEIAGEPENEFAASAVDEIPVAPEERYARHGHFPGVVLLEGRAALAERLERFLFDLGFEVLNLTRPELSGDALDLAIRVARSAGFIVLYSGDSLTGETKHRIALQFDNRFLDIAAAPELRLDKEQAVRHVRAFAQSLKFVDEPPKIQQKVN